MFYDNFIRLCEEQGETPTAVTKKVGCASSNLAMWKKGSTPRASVLQRFADYFGVTAQALLFGNPEEKKEQAPSNESLSPKDARLLDWFRSLPEEKQKAILSLGGAPEDLL